MAASAPVLAEAAETPAPVVAQSGADRLWLAAQDLLRRSGECEGPELLDQLHALAGNGGAAKGLLVRLRHSPNVKIEVRDGAQVFTWNEGV
ncbi:MAG: hypothetical protein GAK43_01520 [Stenotrophomonas maltophilia]|nr:MAG: hypothetical protein GAK43_01520 [Stenotrophomonas maltophilia]